MFDLEWQVTNWIYIFWILVIQGILYSVIGILIPIILKRIKKKNNRTMVGILDKNIKTSK